MKNYTDLDFYYALFENMDLLAFPDDIFHTICLCLEFVSLTNFSNVCVEIHALITDDNFAHTYACKLYSIEFWVRAMNRSTFISKPCNKCITELNRLEKFQLEMEKIQGQRFSIQDFYWLWHIMDSSYRKGLPILKRSRKKYLSGIHPA